MSRPTGNRLPSAIGRGDVSVSQGYGRGSSGLVLPMEDEDYRSGDVTENQESGLSISMHISSDVMKAVVDALASFIPKIVSDTLKNYGYDMVLAHRSKFIIDREPRARSTGGAFKDFSDGEPRVSVRVSSGVFDDRNLNWDPHCDGGTIRGPTISVVVFTVEKSVTGGDAIKDISGVAQEPRSTVFSTAEKAGSGGVS
ncbi:hypothetical protein NE237_011983 [Protea cynaroides]|uniref:Uncharacterized protein n=1 Tax=Protea cynaroides TaxID=273540 RepID=A0A9Q0GX79_9MAGN|nr:hypothetical protein NE237_011983 [Protea cynaroides]